MNLAGFFYLAQSFGGIEVCVNSWDGPSGTGTNLHDANSGFNAVADGYNVKKGGSQYLHLAADQALAFVRERDNLPNGDLDRTHRQQAVLDYVIWKLKTGGVLTDVGQLTSLLSTADKYLITDSSWNLLDFSTQMHALSGENLKFYTRADRGLRDRRRPGRQPDRHPSHPGGHQGEVHRPGARSSAASKPAKKAAPIPAASTVTVDVYNGGSTAGLAGQRLGGAGREGLPGRRRHRRVRAVADRRRPRPRCSTARAPRPTPPRSRATSA